MKRLTTTTVLAGLAIILSTPVAFAGVIKVKMWDKGASSEVVSNLGIGGAGDMSKAPMGFTLSTKTVKAGMTTFEVINASKDTIHEMVVFPYKEGGKIPYSDKDAKINEDAAGHLGEVSELGPGKTGTLKIALKRGRYVLACNVANHYMNGMWAIIDVK